MTKSEFLDQLKEELHGLPEQDVSDRLSFYQEMIEDRMEEGTPEEEAVKAIGDIDVVVAQILQETPITKIVKEKIKPRRKPSALEIVLIALGFPLWFPLLLVAFILLLVCYILIWVMVIVTYSVELSFIATGVAGAIAMIITFATGHPDLGIGYLGCFLIGVGLSMLFIYVCIATTKATIKLTKKILLGIKKKMIRRGNKNE